MSFTRRIVILSGAGFALAACMGPTASNLAVSAQARPGMNPGSDGADRPVTISVMQLAATGAFDAADVFALQNPQAALGADLIRVDQLVLAPGGTASRVIAIQPGVAAVGVTAGFLSPAGKVFRQRIAPPASDSGLIVSVGPGGLSLATA